MRQTPRGKGPVAHSRSPRRLCLAVALVAWLLFGLARSEVRAADAHAVGPVYQAIIYYSSAPWDGAAYDIEIPLGHGEGGAQPYLRINIWDYPEFPEPKTLHFSGKEDAGGGPQRGAGRALFKPISTSRCRKTWRVRFRSTPSSMTPGSREVLNSKRWMEERNSAAAFRRRGVTAPRRSSVKRFLRAAASSDAPLPGHAGVNGSRWEPQRAGSNARWHQRGARAARHCRGQSRQGCVTGCFDKNRQADADSGPVASQTLCDFPDLHPVFGKEGFRFRICFNRGKRSKIL